MSSPYNYTYPTNLGTPMAQPIGYQLPNINIPIPSTYPSTQINDSMSTAYNFLPESWNTTLQTWQNNNIWNATRMSWLSPTQNQTAPQQTSGTEGADSGSGSNDTNIWDPKEHYGLSEKGYKRITKANNILGLASAAIPGTKFTDQQNGIRSTVMQLAQSNPILGTSMFIADILDKTVGVPDHVNMKTAERYGRKGAAAFQEFSKNLLGLGALERPFAGKIHDIGNFDNFVARNANDYSGLANKYNAAKEISGSHLLGAGGYNRGIDSDRAMLNIASKNADYNNRLKNNSAQFDINNKNTNRLAGNNGYIGLKQGGKIPELEEARNILSTLLSSKVEKHQNGGILGDKNIIPDGALHRELSHIEEANPELEGQITKKGIPVVSMDEGGEVRQQIAEVEREELTLSKSNSYTLESFYEKYKNASEEEKKEIEIETGKWITDQILHNTQDNTGIIKEIRI